DVNDSHPIVMMWLNFRQKGWFLIDIHNSSPFVSIFLESFASTNEVDEDDWELIFFLIFFPWTSLLFLTLSTRANKAWRPSLGISFFLKFSSLSVKFIDVLKMGYRGVFSER